MSSATDLRVPGLRGRAITRADPEYDRARATFYGGIDHRPDLIVCAADAADVATVVNFARTHGVDLAIRSGGHSPVGLSVSDGGITLDLKEVRDLEIDVAAKTAWVGPGLTSGEMVTATSAHGLGVGFGDTGSVGIGGITNGGGIGYLVRKHGLTIDSLLAAEIVTADGALRRVDAAREPDLFWAIRGGGGNAGIVTRLQFRLHDTSEMLGGFIALPATADAIAAFVALAAAAPEELSTIANVMPAPPMPFLPEAVHGTLVNLAMLVYTGDTDAGLRAIAPFRKIAAPLVDMLKPMTFPDVYPPEDPSYHPIASGRTLFVDAIDRRSVETIVATLTARMPAFCVAQIRVLGGALARVPNDATAFAHRQRHAMISVATLYEDQAEAPTHEAWVDRFAAQLRRGPDGAYVGFLTADGPQRIHAAYPGQTWERLARIKKTYDPGNLFHLNQNVPPAS
ncbi:MAG: FAD-binding oxidoreductase [Chloroflexota bacterium]|nr:FAD-binding oxidoreductase [Chloroflexota bacterium]